MKAKKREFKPTKSECAFIGAVLFVSFFVLWFLFGAWLKDFDLLCWIEKRPGFWVFLQALAALITLVSTLILWLWQVRVQRRTDDERLEEKGKLNSYKKHQLKKFVLSNGSVFAEIEWFIYSFKELLHDVSFDKVNKDVLFSFMTRFMNLYVTYKKSIESIENNKNNLEHNFDANEYFHDIDNILFQYKSFGRFFALYEFDKDAFKAFRDELWKENDSSEESLYVKSLLPKYLGSIRQFKTAEIPISEIESYLNSIKSNIK